MTGVSPRSVKRGLYLTGLLIFVYFSFIGLVAFAPRIMARPAIGVISVGLVCAFAVIIFALVITAVYVWLCNREGLE